MRVRILTGLAVLAAAGGCSKADDVSPTGAKGDEKIACAVGGSAELREVCAVERIRIDDMLQLVVHHPDGGFRRFEVRPNGSGLVPADGADDAQRETGNGMLELTVSGDTYRFPTAIETDAP